MPNATHEEWLARRVEHLTATDPQFAAARPDPAVTEELDQPGLGLSQVIRTVLARYADRPALGQRAVEFVAHPTSGRTVLELLPRFETLTYGELGERADTLARALAAADWQLHLPS